MYGRQEFFFIFYFVAPFLSKVRNNIHIYYKINKLIGMDEKDLYKNIRTGKLEIPVHVPLGARILITRILKINPSERPTPGEVFIFSYK